MINRLFLFIGFCLCLVFTGQTSFAMQSIAMVVNEDAITISDVNDRLRLIIVSSGFPDTQEVKERLLPQILNSLAEEQLMLQEMGREEIVVSPEQINNGFEQIAKQNNTDVESFKGMMEQGGINFDTLKRQISAQIGWSMIVQKKFRPKVNINDTDVDAFINGIEDDTGLSEFLTAEILLPVPDEAMETEIRQLASNLVTQIRQQKVPFSRMAMQFSKAPGAQKGGDLGWIKQGQLPDELDEVLNSLNSGEVSAPIRTQSGYHILLVRQKRVITEDSIPSREQIRNILGSQRLEKMQARHLMNLKSAAFIEKRV